MFWRRLLVCFGELAHCGGEKQGMIGNHQWGKGDGHFVNITMATQSVREFIKPKEYRALHNKKNCHAATKVARL